MSYKGDADLWQAESGFRFTMAGGYLSATPPASFLAPPDVSRVARGLPVPAEQVQTLIDYVHAKHVTSVIVDKRRTKYWAAALDRVASPHDVGGVLLYFFDNPARTCP